MASNVAHLQAVSFMRGLVWVCLLYTDLFVQTIATCAIMNFIIIIICNMIGK